MVSKNAWWSTKRGKHKLKVNCSLLKNLKLQRTNLRETQRAQGKTLQTEGTNIRKYEHMTHTHMATGKPKAYITVKPSYTGNPGHLNMMSARARKQSTLLAHLEKHKKQVHVR